MNALVWLVILVVAVVVVLALIVALRRRRRSGQVMATRSGSAGRPQGRAS